jgi:DNA ligase-associated metallophosphoesterase
LPGVSALLTTPAAPARPLALTHLGVELVLHPERALEVPAERLLLISDVHWGKATTLRAQGVPVPGGGTADDLARLDRVLARTAARYLVVLGDLVHSRHAWTPTALAPLLAWRARWPALAITLVRGNHDAHAGDPPASLRIEAVDAPWRIAALVCSHEPAPGGTEGAVHVFGHLHPTLLLRGRARTRVRLPCFVRGPGTFMLPAFSSFTGGGAWAPAPDESAFAIVDDDVIAVP